MAKLSKAAAKAHLSALALLGKETLTPDERFEVLGAYQEGATHMNGLAGAFFTPFGLALDLTVEIHACDRIIDLCAGIGTLAFAVRESFLASPGVAMPEIVCVERNPDYVAAGRKLLPEATWIEADITALPDLGHFGIAIGNPPFGNVPRKGGTGRYDGPDFELRAIDIASDLADYGVFIVPQMSAPFAYSGRRSYERTPSAKTKAFEDRTGIVLEMNCGIDASVHKDEWHGVAPAVEIVCVDFVEARRRRAPKQGTLFAA